jgi:serine/threonine protein kinase
VAILAEASIPQIVRLGPVGITEGEVCKQKVLFYTEEWVEGRDLSTILRESGPLPVAEVARMGIELCRAIEWLWEHHTIHRDIKPGNVMRRPDGSFVLLDMGLALDLEQPSITTPGLTVGTLPYLSPEQLDAPKKRTMDFRSDLYSLGVTMYEASTGVHPYFRPGMSQTDTITRILTEKPKPPVDLNPLLPGDLSTIIMRLLAKSPYLRYRNCARFVADLEPVVDSLGGMK